MIKFKNVLTKSAISTIVITQIASQSTFIPYIGQQVANASTNSDHKVHVGEPAFDSPIAPMPKMPTPHGIPGTYPRIYEFKDEEDLKYKIFSDRSFVRSYANIANALGFAWCGGTERGEIGEGFDVWKSGQDYIIQAKYNKEDLFASGYRAGERLKMTVSNVRFYTDTNSLVTGKPKVSDLKPLVTGTYNLDNYDQNNTDEVGTEVNYQISSKKSHTTNGKFSNTLGLKAGFKFTAGKPGVASTEFNTELSYSFTTEKGWAESKESSVITTLKNSYKGKVPPNSRRHVELVTLTNKADVPYKANVYVEYTITFSGFLKWGGNARTDHPTDRPTVSYTFGQPGTKSAVEDIWDQYTHKDIPGYSTWDWKSAENQVGGKRLESYLMEALASRGGEITGNFHFDNATVVNIKADNKVQNLLDGNLSTVWTSEWDKNNGAPQSVTLNLGKEYNLCNFKYTPRQDGSDNGTATKYKIYVSKDGENFKLVSYGEWNNDNTEKNVDFTPVKGSHVKFEIVNGTGGWASGSELKVSAMMDK